MKAVFKLCAIALLFAACGKEIPTPAASPANTVVTRQADQNTTPMKNVQSGSIALLDGYYFELPDGSWCCLKQQTVCMIIVFGAPGHADQVTIKQNGQPDRAITNQKIDNIIHNADGSTTVTHHTIS